MTRMASKVLLDRYPIIRECLEGKCDIDEQDEFGRTALYCLCKDYDEDIDIKLFSLNPNVNIPDNEGTYPIHLVSLNEDSLLAVEKLISFGVDVNVTDKYGRTALHISVFYNTRPKDVVKLLLAYSCHIEACDNEGNTALHYAAMRSDSQSVNIISLLHSQGANFAKKNKYGKRPLHYASTLKAMKFFSSNTSIADLNNVDMDRKTVLHYAASNFNSTKQVELLIQKGADANICDSCGRNALIYACKEGSAEMTKRLIQYSASVNVQDEQRNTALHYAAQRIGGLEHAVELARVATGIDLNLQNFKGQTALMLTLEKQQFQTANFLITSNANVHIQDDLGRSPLHYAVLYNTKHKVADEDNTNPTVDEVIESTADMIRNLVQNGAYTSNTDHEGMTPLHYACMVRNGINIVEVLVNANANLEAVDCNGKRPILLAAEFGDLKIVEYLLRRMIEISVLDEQCISSLLQTAIKTPNECVLVYLLNQEDFPPYITDEHLLAAARFGTNDILQSLCEIRHNVHAVDINNQTVLHLVCRREIPEMATFVIEKNCELNAVDKDGNTPLHVAIQHSSVTIVHTLMDKGADINIVNKRGQLPIHLACKYADLETVKRFFSDAAQLRQNIPQDKDEKTILHYAAENKNTSVIEYVVSSGIDVNAVDSDGKVVLHYGSKYMTPETVEIFHKHGGNVNAVDKRGRTALHYAAQEGNASFIFELVRKGCSVNKKDHKRRTPLMFAALFDRQNAFEALLNLKADVNCRDVFEKSVFHHSLCEGNNAILVRLSQTEFCLTGNCDGRSPLHLACEENNFEAVYCILKSGKGFDILDQVDKKTGESALHIAAENGQRNIVYLLSISGTNLELKDSKQKTALHKAVLNRHSSVALLLLQHGADVNVEDMEKKTPLFSAVQNNDYKVTKILLRHSASTKLCDKDGRLPSQYTNDETMKTLLLEYKDVGEKLNVSKGLKDNYSLVYSYGDLCFLEMVERRLKCGKVVYVTSQIGQNTLRHMKQHVPIEKLQRMNFLAYRKHDTDRKSTPDDELVKYAYLFLIRNLGPVVQIDINHCYDLCAIISEVEGKYNLPASKTGDILQQVQKAKEKLSEGMQRSDTEANQDSVGTSDGYDDSGTAPSASSRHPLKEYSTLKKNNSAHQDFKPTGYELLDKLTKELRHHGYHKEDSTPLVSRHKIHKYVTERKLHETDVYLRQRKNPNAQDESGWTPLHLSILYGLDEFVSLLLKYNADVNVLTKDVIPNLPWRHKNQNQDSKYSKEFSPLLLAVLLKRKRITRLLAEENISEQDVQTCIELSFGELIEIDILHGIRKQLERRFSTISLQAFPGYLQITPLKRTIIGLSSEVFQTEKLTFLGLDVIIRNLDFCDEYVDTDNHIEEFLTSEEGNTLNRIIATHAPRLWQCHSTLNIISGTSSTVNRNEKASPCVILYSSVKNFIPMIERIFPSLLKVGNAECKVIVREGNASLGPLDPQSRCSIPFIKILRMGSSIGSLGGGSGTMGPVVSLRDGNIGFISCAHVFFDEEIKLSSEVNFCEDALLSNGPTVVQPTDDEIEKAKQNYDFERSFDSSFEVIYNREGNENMTREPEIFRNPELRICGKVIRAVFDPDRDISIDAALVSITKPDRKPRDGSFTAVTKRKLEHLGFKDPPVFHTGNTANTIASKRFGVDVIKYGASSEITRGAVIFDGLQAKLTSNSKLSLYCCEEYKETYHCLHSRTEFIMKGQYQIKPTKVYPFFSVGDSGSGVFTVTKNNELTCIGIAVGVIPEGNAIVTPIEPVLHALGDVKLKTFSSPKKRTASGAFERLSTSKNEDTKRQK